MAVQMLNVRNDFSLKFFPNVGHAFAGIIFLNGLKIAEC